MNKKKLKNILTKIGEINPEYTLEKQVYNVGGLIQFIPNPSQTAQLVVVEKNPYSIRFIQNPSERVQLAAVRKWGWSIEYIQNPSERVQLAAVEKYPRFIYYIKNPTQRVIQLARSKGVKI